MRQRKREDWSVCVYKYWVCLEHQTWEHLPDGAKQEASAMRLLWNQLVEAFEQRRTEYWDLLSQLPQIVDLREKRAALQRQLQQTDMALKALQRRLRRRNNPQLFQLEETKSHTRQSLQEVEAALGTAQQAAAPQVRPALRRMHQRFLAETRLLAAQSPATWANKEFVLNQFFAAMDRFFQKHDHPPKRRFGTPQEVHFHHRFTEGGVPIERIFGRGQRAHLEPVSLAAYDPGLPRHQREGLARTVGTFRVGTVTLPFQTILHRPLPEDAYLKSAALVGRQVIESGYHRHQEGGHLVPARWTWALHLTVELPPQRRPVQEADKPVATLGLGCRQRDDGRLQIGILVDSVGHEEVFCLPEEILRAWQYRRDLQRRIDRLLEDTKAQLRHRACLEKLPLTARRILTQIEKLSGAGLWRLLRLLEETRTDGVALETIRRWADRFTKLRREAKGLERRYLGYRDWFYHNLTVQLCRRYQRLVVETASLQAEGENFGQDPAPYPHFTALSGFLRFLKHAAAKTGTEIIVATETPE
jgi:hypothetical protein